MSETVELELSFVQIGPKTWVNPHMVCRVQDDQPVAGQDDDDTGCTVYMVDETTVYLRKSCASDVVGWLTGAWVYHDE